MATFAPSELPDVLDGVMSFPVTPFSRDGALDEPRLREHVAFQVEQGPAAVFPACGTGEFFSLHPEECERVAGVTVQAVNGRMPVIAGSGYGAPLAVDLAKRLEAAGVDGLLVLPPYLLGAEQDGLYEHYRTIAESTSLALILYQRDNARFAPETVARLAQLDNVIGLKDGQGDVESLQRIRVAVDDDFIMLNGMPTAEASALTFAGLGITSYSSAVLNFVPEVAMGFSAALRAGRHAEIRRYLREFYDPFVKLRDQVKGYAMSLVRTGVSLRLGPVGPPRPPLVAVSPEHEEQLAALIDHGLRIAHEEADAGVMANESMETMTVKEST